MVKSAFHEFTAFRVHHRNLLEARMKIYPYNQHTRLLSSRVLVSYALPSLLGLGEEPTLLSNQFLSDKSWRAHFFSSVCQWHFPTLPGEVLGSLVEGAILMPS